MAETLSPTEVQKAIDYLLKLNASDLNSEEPFVTCVKLYNSTKFKNLQEQSMRTQMSISFGQICEVFSKIWKFKKECPIDLTKSTDRTTQFYILIMRMVWNTTDLFDNVCSNFLDRGLLCMLAEDFSSAPFLERANLADQSGDLIVDCINGYIGICLSVVKRSVLQMRFVNDARAANMVSILKNYTASK